MRSLLLSGLVLCMAGLLNADSTPASNDTNIGLNPNVAEGAPRLPAGTRGYVIFLPKESASGFEPSQHVDVSVAYGPVEHRVNKTVARNVLLVATGEGIGPHKSSTVLTLAVTPNDADKLDRARKSNHTTILVRQTSSRSN